MDTTQIEECAVSPNSTGSQDRDTEFSSPREEGCWAKADVLSDVRQMLQAIREAQIWLRTQERGSKGEATEKGKLSMTWGMGSLAVAPSPWVGRCLKHPSGPVDLRAREVSKVVPQEGLLCSQLTSLQDPSMA